MSALGRKRKFTHSALLFLELLTVAYTGASKLSGSNRRVLWWE
jgi:hypothetical protein